MAVKKKSKDKNPLNPHSPEKVARLKELGATSVETVGKKPPREKARKKDPVSEKRLDQIMKNDLVKVEPGEQRIPLENDAISATIHEGLMDYLIEGTHLRLLGMIDPKETPSVEQRVAMARRLNEVGPFLPRYIKSVELTSHKAFDAEEVKESQEVSVINQERRKKTDAVNGVGKVYSSPTETDGHRKRTKRRVEEGKTSSAPATPKVPKAEAIPGGIPLKKLCADVDIDPKDARRCLRAKKVEKPGGRWEWTPERAEEIKVILRAERDAITRSKL